MLVRIEHVLLAPRRVFRQREVVHVDAKPGRAARVHIGQADNALLPASGTMAVYTDTAAMRNALAAARIRLYRLRLARGARVVALEVAAQDVAALVAAGLLPSKDQHEPAGVAAAIARLLDRLSERAALAARPQAASPAPTVPVPAPPPQRFASVVEPGFGGSRRRG